MTKNLNESSCNNQRVVNHLEVVALLVDVENLEAGHVVALPGVVLVHVLVVVDGDRVRFVRRLELRVLQITHIPQVSLRVPVYINKLNIMSKCIEIYEGLRTSV